MIWKSISIDFPSYSQHDTLFHHIAYDSLWADWDSLHDHLRHVPWEDIFKLGPSAAASEWVQVGIDIYIYLIENMTSSLIHLHGFQVLALLPQFIETTAFVCTKRMNLLILK